LERAFQQLVNRQQQDATYNKRLQKSYSLSNLFLIDAHKRGRGIKISLWAVYFSLRFGISMSFERDVLLRLSG
jgi:hypothetical protein